MSESQLMIIGGGASGLFAAALASRCGLSVTLLEKNSRCGRKLALTGKGRCNLTNTKPWEEFATHIHPKNLFLKNAFFGMSNLKVMDFFREIGLPLVVERGDRVFPESMRAQDVTDVLLSYMESNGAKLFTDFEVVKVERQNGLFCVTSKEGRSLCSNSLLICTGGLSYPTTGSTGDGYRFARDFGHTITTCFPSLTALKPLNYSQAYYGISLKNVEVSLFVNGDRICSEFGDLDFTNGGIEGPIGFKISRKAVCNLLNGQKVSLMLDLKPAVSMAQLRDRISRESSAIGHAVDSGKWLKVLLGKLLPQALISPFILSNSPLTLSNLPEKLKGWRFDIVDYVGYERCVVTAGGVSLREVSQKSMESKLVEGLYFAGEVLDLDGDTGGYNLQIAFSTAALAVASIAKKLSL